VTLTYEAMEVAANPGLTIAVYTAEPGSKSEEAVNRLASWSAAPTSGKPPFVAECVAAGGSRQIKHGFGENRRVPWTIRQLDRERRQEPMVGSTSQSSAL
jgi:hypothetical protein